MIYHHETWSGFNRVVVWTNKRLATRLIFRSTGSHSPHLATWHLWSSHAQVGMSKKWRMAQGDPFPWHRRYKSKQQMVRPLWFGWKSVRKRHGTKILYENKETIIRIRPPLAKRTVLHLQERKMPQRSVVFKLRNTSY